MVFVFDALIEEFSNDNRPITQDQYRFLGQQVKGKGVKRDDILFVSAAPPAPKEVHDRDKAIGIHLMDHRDDFKKIVEWAKPKLIVSFGNQATRQTVGRSVKITKVRGQFIQSEEFGCPVLPVFGLFYTMKYPENVDILSMDMHTLSRCVANDYVPNYEVESEQDYKWVTDLQFIVDAMPKHLCVDTETVNLTTHDALDVFHPDTKILTVQFCYEAGKAYAIDIRDRKSKTTKKLIRQLRQILTHPKIAKFGHNFKYDCHVLYQDLGIDIVNYEDDTQLLAHAIDENMKQKNQNECVKRWVREMSGYCLAKGTKVLRADMEHVNVENLRIGDKLIGFDEYPVEKSSRRKMRTATVTDFRWVQKYCIRLRTAFGREITVSTDHKFLTKNRKGGNWGWKATEDLRVGDTLMPFPWEKQNDTYDGGYMAGIYDGEGYITRSGAAGMRIGFAQSHGPVLDKAKAILASDGFSAWVSTSTDTRKPLDNVVMPTWAAMRALQMYRPVRLIEKAPWEGKALPSLGVNATDYIVDMEYVGRDYVAWVSTDTRTLIAEGICTHNCDEFDKDPVHQGKTRMDLVPPDKLLAYGCGDVDSCFRLRTRLRTLLHKEGEKPTRCYERITMPAQRAFLQIERHGGFPVSVGALKALQRYLVAEQERLYTKLVKPVPKYFIETYSQDKRVIGKDGKPTKVKTFNVTRPVFLIDYMFKHKKGLRLTPRVFTNSSKNNPDPEKRIPSTSAKDHFPYFIADSEWVQDLTAYMKNQKMLSTYVGVEADEKGKPTGFFKYIRNGYIRPSYRLDGTTTGRPSSQNPNGQNFPKRGDAAKKFRRVFIAPAGWVYVSCDYAQIELKLAAMFAKAHSMLNLYKKGVDIHMATAAAVMKISLQAFKDLPKEVQSLARFRAKAVNFGFLYGMWWRKFREYAKTQYGVDYTDQEAEEIRRIFFQKYNELEDWYKQVESFVRRYGFVETATGRRRHLPSVRSNDEQTAKAAVRQAINSPVQGTGSDLGLLAISRLYDDGICNDDFRVVGFIHDDIVCLAREKVAMKAVRILKRYMETNPLADFGFKPEIKITAAPSIGYNLASLLELDDYGLTGKKHLTSVQDLIDEINKEEDEDRRNKMLKELGKPHDESEFEIKPAARKRLRIRVASKPKKRIIKLRRAA